MKKVAILCLFILLGLMIAPALALYNCSLSPVMGTFTGNAPWTHPTYDELTGVDAATAKTIIQGWCTAEGYTLTEATAWTYVQAMGINALSVNHRYVAGQYGPWYNDNNATYYVQRQATCNPGLNQFAKLQYLMRVPINPANCIAGTYHPDATFTYAPVTPWTAPEEVQFTANTGGTPKSDTFQWDISYATGGLLFSSYGLSQINYTFSVAEQYRVNLTVTNTSSSTSATSSQVFTVSDAEQFSITVSPAFIPADGSQYLYGEIHSTPVAKLQNITSFYWTYKKYNTGGTLGPVTSFYNVSSPTHTLAYVKKIDGYYYEHDGSDFNYKLGTTLPNPLSLNPVGEIGTIITKCNIAVDDGRNLEFTVSNLIGDSANSTNQVTITVQDAFTGYRIYNPVISVYNQRLGIWNNVTAASGEQAFNVPEGDIITVYTTADGYIPYSAQSTVQANSHLYVNMVYDTPIVGNMTRLIVRASIAPPSPLSGTPIQGIQITVKNPANTTDSQYFTTDSTGKALFDVFPNTTYQIVATGGTYTSQLKTISTGTTNPYDVVMWMYATTATATPTPGGVTFTPTPSSVIPTGTSGGYGGFWGPFAQGLESAGADSSEFGILLAAFIIFIGFCIGGWSGSAYSPGTPFNGIGSIAGGAFGFILATAFGFIPILYVVVIILGAVFVLIFFR